MKAKLKTSILLLSAVATLSNARGQSTSGLDDKAVPPPKESKTEKGKPERPEKEPKEVTNEVKEGRADAVAEIKSDFRSKAQEYVKKQKELVTQLKGANAEERTKIREKLKDLKEKWNDDQPKVRELVSDLRDKIDKDKDQGKGNAGGRPRK